MLEAHPHPHPPRRHRRPGRRFYGSPWPLPVYYDSYPREIVIERTETGAQLWRVSVRAKGKVKYLYGQNEREALAKAVQANLEPIELQQSTPKGWVTRRTF